MGIGFIDIIGDRKVSGWASGDKGGPVVVELLADGILVGEAIADIYREDLVYAGYGDGRHGWIIEVPPDLWKRSFTARIKNDGLILTNNAEKNSKRHFQNFLNSTFNGFPIVECGFTSRTLDQVDVAVASELIEISKHISEYGSEPGSIWDIHDKASRSTFKQILRQEDPEKLADFLVTLPTKQEAEGFLQGEAAYRAFLATDSVGLGVCEGPTKDELLSLAQYLSIERLESVEVGALGEAIHLDQRLLATRIENEIGIKLAPPMVLNGLLGIRIDSGVLDRRAIQAVYTAHRLLSVSERTEGHLCEIGGGIGMAAYYAVMLGSKKFTIVDLNNMCLFQYFYLRRALPDHNIAIITSFHQAQSDINIVPASVFNQLGNEWRWDAIVNCDSFPEMGEAICSRYFSAFRGHSPLLLSINQEANSPLTADVYGARQPVVSQMLRHHPGYRRLYRFRSWLRHGFSEELYQIDRPATGA